MPCLLLRMREPHTHDEEPDGVVDADAGKAEALNVGAQDAAVLGVGEVRAELVAVQVRVAEQEVGDRRSVVGEAALLHERGDGARGVVGEAVDKGDEERVPLLGPATTARLAAVGRRVVARLLDRRQLDVAALDDALDDKVAVERRREGLARQWVVLDDGLGNDEHVGEEEQVPVLDRVGIDDLEDGRMQEQLARRRVERARPVSERRGRLCRREERVELGEDAARRVRRGGEGGHARPGGENVAAVLDRAQVPAHRHWRVVAARHRRRRE